MNVQPEHKLDNSIDALRRRINDAAAIAIITDGETSNWATALMHKMYELEAEIAAIAEAERAK